MRTVKKYPLRRKSPDDFSINLEMPQGAKIFLFAEESGRPNWFAWAEVETDAPLVHRSFVVLSTDEPVPDGFEHVGSARSHGGIFVWHLYEWRG